jgi:hypothetical protein
MPTQTWVNLLNAGAPWQTTQGTVLSASASTATISPQAATGQDFVLPGQPNGLQWYPGMTLRVKARGTLGSGGTASNLQVWLACGVSGTLATSANSLSTTAAVALGTGSVSSMPWKLEANINVLALGSTGSTLSTEGELLFETSSTPAFGTSNTTIAPLPLTSLAFNTYTAATALGLRASLSAAFGNIQCNQFTIEQLS